MNESTEFRIPAVQETAMYELAEKLKSLRDEKAAAEEHVKSFAEEIARVDEKLSSLMAETETQNFTRAGTTFSLTNKTRASATAERKTELYEALKENGYGELVYETVNANTLSSFVKEQIEENNDILPEWLDGLVNVFEQTTVSVRKSTKKSK